MIGAVDIRELARAQALRDTIVEKDYVIGWLLWAIGEEPTLAESWAFKGGTCLRKCYFQEYRFSEDLDFTVTNDAPLDPADLERRLVAVANRVYEASGIEVPPRLIRVEPYVTQRGMTATEVRLSYRGPLSPAGDLPACASCAPWGTDACRATPREVRPRACRARLARRGDLTSASDGRGRDPADAAAGTSG
jgi:hypothetical protein